MKIKTVNFKFGGKVHFISITEGHHEIVLERDGRCEGNITGFGSDWGNYWFVFCKRDCMDFDYFSENVFLDHCAYSYDFDGYSDLYKDCNGCRPHYTQEEWRQRIKVARERKP